MSQTNVEQITVHCACGKKLKAPASALGKKAKCPKCGNIIRVEVPPPQDDGGLDLDALYDIAEREAQVAATQEAGSPAQMRCPSCAAGIDAGAVLCVNCGYDMRSKKKIAPKADAPEPEKKAGWWSGGGGKVKDKLAPQRSIFLGIAGAAAGALVGGAIWFGVAMATGYEFAFIGLVVGGATGAGMQLGQQGYSTLGGLIAAGMTFLGVLLAKLAIVAAVLMPLANRAARAGEPIEEETEVNRTIVEEFERQAYAEMKLDPAKADIAQIEQVQKRAQAKAERLTRAERDALLKAMKQRETERAETEQLESMYIYEYAESRNINLGRANEKVRGQVETEARQKLDAMTPSQRAAELKRIKAERDAEMKEAMKQFEDAMAEEEKKSAAPAGADEDTDEDEDEDESASGMSTGAKVGFGVMLIGLLFGIKGLFFTIGGMFVAYRTAAGAVWD